MRMFSKVLVSATLAATAFGIAPAAAFAAPASPATSSGWTATASPGSEAEEFSEIAAAACQVRVYRPEVAGRQVKGTAWAPGCSSSTRVYVELQRKRAWGWEKIASKTFNAPGPVTLRKGCRAGDLFTYRMYGKVIGGGQGVSPEKRARC